jgi:beta-glucanase (GH16 family)
MPRAGAGAKLSGAIEKANPAFRPYLRGGEILTNELHGYGSYSARMSFSNVPGSIRGFFLYEAPDYESEIDVEVFNDSTRRIMFTT